VWLFSSGPVGRPPTPDGDPVDVADLIRRTGAREHHVFSGRLDRSTLGFVERTVSRAVHAPEGDFRDWVEVRAWADHIAAELTSFALGPDVAAGPGPRRTQTEGRP
jgi:menaquinone-dependent protoporphyrinogen oxidase